MPDCLSRDEVTSFETFDLVYRSLCAMLFNYVPTSGHPGGSISSGRFVSGLLFGQMDYDVSAPDREDADVLSYAAGHKALGLYSLYALRDEIIRIGVPNLLPDKGSRLRLEDLLGFRRSPVTSTPLFLELRAKALDGHPTPVIPNVPLSTGASGVGLASSIGFALAALDYYGKDAPRIHIVEGEGGLTPGRASEALAAAAAASLGNVILHVDWNQASIDSDRVCREGEIPGDYVQWNPMELAYLHDWNVIFVPDGKDFQQISAAQRLIGVIDNCQPTAIVYRTVKGWRYGIEGKASHGAGHNLCSNSFYESVAPLLQRARQALPMCRGPRQRCQGGKEKEILERCLWDALLAIRAALEGNRSLVNTIANCLIGARDRLNGRRRTPRSDKSDVDKIFSAAAQEPRTMSKELLLSPGVVTTLRGQTGRVLQYYNRISKGAIFLASADLLNSASMNAVVEDFPKGYFNSVTNPGARLLSLGGICEDAMSGILSGISSFGHHIGVGSSYAAFIAPLSHIASRLHAIGNQVRQANTHGPYRTMILVCAHAGLKTGEDGPTHADPQSLQILQENFPRGTLVTLTPWEPQEIWPLVSAALTVRPAVIAPFVTRPSEEILDREARGLADACSATSGVYLLHPSEGRSNAVVVLQGSDVAYAFVQDALPLLVKEGMDVEVYYVASAELYDLLPVHEQERIFPEALAQKAMGITGFTLPTMYRWVRSDQGRRATLHAFQRGHYLGSGQAEDVLAEAGLDGESQFKAIAKYVKGRQDRKTPS